MILAAGDEETFGRPIEPEDYERSGPPRSRAPRLGNGCHNQDAKETVKRASAWSASRIRRQISDHPAQLIQATGFVSDDDGRITELL